MSSSSSSRSMSSGVGGMGLHGGSASSSTYVGGGGMMHGGGSISVGKELAIARKVRSYYRSKSIALAYVSEPNDFMIMFYPSNLLLSSLKFSL